MIVTTTTIKESPMEKAIEAHLATASAIGVDVGATFIKAGLVDLRKDSVVGTPLLSETPATLQKFTEKVTAFVATLRALAPGAPVGLGIPGVVKRGKLCLAPQLGLEFEGLQLDAHLEPFIHTKPSIINDADAFGLAEMSGRSPKDLRPGTTVVLTFGTGVGTALLQDGVLFRNIELGRMDLNGVRRYEKAINEQALREKGEQAWRAATVDFLNELIDFLSPERFIIGGGMCREFERLFDPLVLKRPIPVLPAFYGAEGGIVGAAFATRFGFARF